jgi:hypothetical protein
VKLQPGEEVSMKRFLTSASQAVGPDGLGSIGKWLIAGALTFGIAPVSVQAQDIMGYGQPGTGQTAPIAAATLFGLPAENGRLQWPLGLRILPTDETKALCEQLELVLYLVATQAAEGRVNRVLIDLGLQAMCDLRQLLRLRESTMYPVTYTEAMRFLDRAERGLTKIKRIETISGGAYP